MNEKQLEKLNTLMALLKEDTIGPKEIEQFLLLVLDVIKKTKNEFENVSQERLKIIDRALLVLEQKQTDFLSKVETDISEKESSLVEGFKADIGSVEKAFSTDLEAVQNAIKELKKISAELKSIEIHDGKDADQNAIIAEVLTKIKLPAPVVLDGPTDIVNKLETLDGPDRLKYTAIDGLEEFIDARILEVTPKGGVFRNTIGGGVTQIKAGSGVTISSTGSNGRGVVTISASGASVADGDYGDITVSSSGTVWTIDNLAVTNAKINDVAWGKITGAPTTISGYGITDAVTKVGTPVNNQIGVWTGDGTLKGDVDLIWDTSTNTLGIGLISLDARVQVHAVKSDASDGLLIEASDGTDIGVLGVANTANVTWYGSHNFSAATQDTIAAFTGAGKTLGSLSTATYPSLTELSYVKGVTSSIQTQINSKGSGTVTNTGGNLTSNAVVLGAGTSDTKVVAGITTDGTSVLILGVNTTTIGKVKMFGNTSGDVTIQPTAVAGTATVWTIPATTDTFVGKATTDTLTNKRNQPRIVSATSYTTDTGTSLDVSTCDIFIVTAQAGALKFNNPSGTPVQGEKLIIRIKDNGTARALTYDTQFRASSDLALPTTTVLSKTLYMGFIYNSTDTKWDLIAVLNNFT